MHINLNNYLNKNAYEDKSSWFSLKNYKEKNDLILSIKK